MSHAKRYLRGHPLLAFHIKEYHDELVEVCCIPLTAMYTQDKKLTPFHTKILPLKKYPQKFQGLDLVESRSQFERWAELTLASKPDKKLIPITYGWCNYQPLVKSWLGSSFEEYLHRKYRDLEIITSFYSDRTNSWEEEDLQANDLEYALNFFGTDCADTNSVPLITIAIAEAYEKSLRKFLPGFPLPRPI